MRKALFLCCSLLLLTAAQAQVRLGLRAGLSTTDLQVDPLTVFGAGGLDYLQLAVDEAYYGIQAGLVLQARIGERFLFQPELLFHSNRVDFRVRDLVTTGSATEIARERYQHLDIPVLLGWRFGPLRLQAGPEAHIFLNSSSELFDYAGYGQRFRAATYGWLAGLGLDIWNIMLDVRYQGNFTKFGDHIRFNEQDYTFDNSPARWLFSVGILFGD
jgi:hypothetical protein